MRARGVFVAAALASAAIAGCGGSGARTPSLSGLPLVAGAHVTESRRTCDRGAGAYCSLQFVVIGRRFANSVDMSRAERRLLKRDHWSDSDAPEGLEVAADSPDDRIRVVWATANNDLEAAELGWIRRVAPVRLALSRTILSRTSALSMLLVLGAG
jgi:hypothetical protein